MLLFVKTNDKIMKKDLVLVQSNALTEGRYEFDLIEKRIVYFIIKQVREDFVEKQDGQRDIFEDLVVKVPIDSLRRADPNIKRLYESSKRLRSKDIEINNEDIWINIGFINYAKHLKKEDIMEFGVSKQILPHLVELSKNFTVYELAVSIVLKSVYSQRFYEICSKWKNAGYCFYKLENLRRMLACEDKFKTFGEFKRGVLDMAKKELKELYDQGVGDLYFDYDIKEKDRKKVISLELSIHTRDSEKNKPTFTRDDMLNFIHVQMKTYYPKDVGFIDRTMDACSKDMEVLGGVFEKMEKKLKAYPRNEYGAVLRYVLKNDFDIK